MDQLSRNIHYRYVPTVWDTSFGTTGKGQLEVYPEPDQEYFVRMDYYRLHNKFTEDDDVCPIYPERLVFLHALANAKAYYNQPDAQVFYTQLDQLLMKIRGNQLQGVVFRRRTPYDRLMSDKERFDPTKGGGTGLNPALAPQWQKGPDHGGHLEIELDEGHVRLEED